MNTQIAIVIITAILAPVLTKFVDLFISYRLKRFELMYSSKVEKYMALSAAYGELHKPINNDQKRKFVSLLWSSALICDKNSRTLLLSFLAGFEENNNVTSPELDELFSRCVESLSYDIERFSKLIAIYKRNK